MNPLKTDRNVSKMIYFMCTYRLPAKLKYPGDVCIPCLIGNVSINRALSDLGSTSSLLPYSIFMRLNLGELRPTSISLQLVDCSMKYPWGILKDVPIRVGDLYIPVDFIDMAEDARS